MKLLRELCLIVRGPGVNLFWFFFGTARPALVDFGAKLLILDPLAEFSRFESARLNAAAKMDFQIGSGNRCRSVKRPYTSTGAARDRDLSKEGRGQDESG